MLADKEIVTSLSFIKQFVKFLFMAYYVLYPLSIENKYSENWKKFDESLNNSNITFSEYLIKKKKNRQSQSDERKKKKLEDKLLKQKKKVSFWEDEMQILTEAVDVDEEEEFFDLIIENKKILIEDDIDIMNSEFNYEDNISNLLNNEKFILYISKLRSKLKQKILFLQT